MCCIFLKRSKKTTEPKEWNQRKMDWKLAKKLQLKVPFFCVHPQSPKSSPRRRRIDAVPFAFPRFFLQWKGNFLIIAMTYIQPKGASHRAKRDFWSYLDAATVAGDKPVAIGVGSVCFASCCTSFFVALHFALQSASGTRPLPSTSRRLPCIYVLCILK